MQVSRQVLVLLRSRDQSLPYQLPFLPPIRAHANERAHLVQLHHLGRGVLLGLVQRSKLDLGRRQSLRSHHPVNITSLLNKHSSSQAGSGRTDLVRDVAGSNFVEVVRPDRDEGTLPGQVGVELVLQVDEARVAELVKLDVAEDGRGKVRADLGRLGLDADRSLLALHNRFFSIICE